MEEVPEVSEEAVKLTTATTARVTSARAAAVLVPERTCGPIESELRLGPPEGLELWKWVWNDRDKGGLSMPAFDHVCEQKERFGIDMLPLSDHDELLPDLLSEAIEAAEALGL